MKFSAYQQVVRPGVMAAPQTAAVQSAARNLDAYGGTGKGAAAWAAAAGQVANVLQKRQDDMDTADEMAAKKQILSTLSDRLYGEGGLMRTGIGENAKGLSDRVQKEIQNVASGVAENYNGRVKMRLQQHLSDNMYDFQRMADRQEWRELEAAEKADYEGTLAVLSTNAVRFSSDANFMGSTMESVEREIASYGEKRGWTGQQIQAAINKNIEDITSQAARNAMKSGDKATAERIMRDYGPQMNPATLADLRGEKAKDKLDAQKRDTMAGVIARHRTPGGYVDWGSVREELEQFEIPGEPIAGAGAEAVAKGFAKWNGKTMDYKRVGCVEAALNILADGGIPFAQEERDAGVVGIPKLEEHAREKGIAITPFDEGSLNPGDIVVYDGGEHVLVYEGEGMVVGNSSSALDDIYGAGNGPGKVMRQNLYQGQTPTSIIRTGSGAAGQAAGRKLTPAEVDAWEQYGRRMEAQAEADRKAMEKARLEAIVNEIEGAGSYQDAMDIVESSGLSKGQQRTLEAQIKREFGISQEEPKAPKGRTKTYDPEKDLRTVRLYQYTIEKGEEVKTSLQVDADIAANRLKANGIIEGGANLDRKDVWERITEMQAHGVPDEDIRETLRKDEISETAIEYYMATSRYDDEEE